MIRVRTIVRLSLVLLFSLCVLPVAAAAQETQDTMQLAAQLRAARAASMQALSKLAGADVATHFADDIVVQFGVDEFRGKQAAAGWIGQTLQSLHSLSFGAPSFTIKDGEVIERSSYTVVTPPDGASQQGAVETVWRKDAAGAWKIARMSVM